MARSTCVNLEIFMEEFTQLEQKITEVNVKNNALEIKLEDANRLVKFYLSREKCLIEERDSLLDTVNSLQQTLQEQFILRVENERLKNDMANLKQQTERIVENGEAEVQRLVSEIREGEERHKRELESIREQCQMEVECAHRQSFSQLEAKEAEVKNLLEKKDMELEEMQKRLKNQDRERQSEILNLQMAFGAKLARVESAAHWNQQQKQQQQHGSNLLPQSVFKRKLQYFQEEKNKEVSALRQRIKQLEENQRASSLNDSRLKRRKI
ncbi:coiled-coil domain-containing protein 152-like [Betta splendens]|uniref:Coiled-coil domain-containing protein 152-like n=1 Tax=Betta splendens TaxID=158456 RepID=A0A8M1HLH3_BETSP|nr:coiled-coil domain-containing protein 152-like [Betta splendens]